MLDVLTRMYEAQMAENLRMTQKLSDGVTRLTQFAPTSPLSDGAPRELVYEDRRMRLFRYPAAQPQPIPMLIVYALVNKPYMLDLAPEKSFIRALGGQGIEIYLSEWKEPVRMARQPSLAEYVTGSIRNAVACVNERHGRQGVNLMGICQGGTLSLIYTALYPETVRNLITVVTPLDFHAGNNLFTHLSRHTDTAKVSDILGTLPGDMLNIGFLQFKPFELMIGKYLGMLDLVDDPEKLDFFMRMEQWIYDGQGLSGPAWHKFIKDCYQENRLVNNEMELGGVKIDLASITCPVLSATADKDHLVPLASSEAIGKVIRSQDYTHLRFTVGHIGMFVSEAMKKKVTPAIGQWLIKHNPQ